MKSTFKIITEIFVDIIIIAVFIFLFFNFHNNPSRSLDDYIQQVIKTDKKSGINLLNSKKDTLKDFKIYRDGEKLGIVYEYILFENLVVDRDFFKSDNFKSLGADSIKKGGNMNKINKLLNKGIYFRIIFKLGENDILTDFKVSKSDFESPSN